MGSGGIVYLPIVSGILSATLKSDNRTKNNVDVQPFIFRPDSVEHILSHYANPNIAAFSISMWNENLSLAVAKALKKNFPEIVIVFGGAQCPHNPTDYMIENFFIDYCIRGEGEEAFVDLIDCIINNKSTSDVPNLSYRSKGGIVINKNEIKFDRSLDKYTSPYLSGEFDYLLNENGHNYQAIIETNRGCPFLCTFCYWGKGGTTTKYRYKGIETVFAEIEYLASKKVEYIFNADSNFGMHKRDYEIAQKLCEMKKKYGYPEKFRTCWGKNTNERIFKIASLLHYHELDKGVTLARQSNSEVVLNNIKRENIKLESYAYLERNFNQLQVPIYAELILGLPGETYQSFKNSINLTLNSGINNQLFIYQAEVYPNTEMADKDYIERHKIEVTKIKLNEIHCSPRDVSWIIEHQYIVTATSSMSNNDWIEMNRLSIFTMLIHSMKIGNYILLSCKELFEIDYIVTIETIINSKSNLIVKLNSYIETYLGNILEGEGRGIFNERYSDVYLDIEEVLFMMISENKNDFYSNILEEFKDKLSKNQFDIFVQIVKFQMESLPSFTETSDSTLDFSYNIDEYLSNLEFGISKKIKVENTVAMFTREQYASIPDFVKTRIIRARKSGTIIWRSKLFNKIKNENLVKFTIESDSQEESFKINLFDNNRRSYSKFRALR